MSHPRTRSRWQVQAQYLNSLITGLNAHNGHKNCLEIALRLDEHFTAGKPLNNSPIPESADIAPNVITDHFEICQQGQKARLKITRSTTDHPVLLQRCTPTNEHKQNPVRIDLTDDTNQIIELHVDIKNNKSIQLYHANAVSIIDDLQSLPKRKRNGTAHGFIVYTLKSNHHIGHLANWYVDERNQVYFCDAQSANPDTMISALPPMIEHLEDLFYLQTMPPEGFIIKQEIDSSSDEEKLSSINEETVSSSEESDGDHIPLFDVEDSDHDDRPSEYKSSNELQALFFKPQSNHLTIGKSTSIKHILNWSSNRNDFNVEIRLMAGTTNLHMEALLQNNPQYGHIIIHITGHTPINALTATWPRMVAGVKLGHGVTKAQMQVLASKKNPRVEEFILTGSTSLEAIKAPWPKSTYSANLSNMKSTQIAALEKRNIKTVAFSPSVEHLFEKMQDMLNSGHFKRKVKQDNNDKKRVKLSGRQ